MSEAYAYGYEEALLSKEPSLDRNNYDRDSDYENWHQWNDGFFDGYAKHLEVFPKNIVEENNNVSR